MTSSGSDWPAAPDFHPEFGSLCPSARKRRGLRLITALLATTLTIGATMGFALEHRTEGVGPAATAAAEQPLPEAAPAADPTRARETCNGDLVQGLATFFLNINSPCGSSKPHARRGARMANRVATVIIGRAEALPAATAATAVEPSQIDSGKAEGLTKVTTAAPERTASPRKPKTRTTTMALAASPAVSAYAAVPRSRFQYDQPQSYQSQYYQPYGDRFRSIAPQGGFAAASGRSWRQWP
jgi:hypothetical protein